MAVICGGRVSVTKKGNEMLQSKFFHGNRMTMQYQNNTALTFRCSLLLLLLLTEGGASQLVLVRHHHDPVELRLLSFAGSRWLELLVAMATAAAPLARRIPDR